MNGNGREGRADKPLLGAVLCCTSVPPELRTQYAEYVTQMGAEHKLDLTSDVTHLLVGDTNTQKYQYVARERPDVKVLRPEWVEAVRSLWMNDEDVTLNALEASFKLPTLAGLKICITGFDDLQFRSQLQEEVIQNGGEYSGDLTRDVTHLIAAVPDGKKYVYATQWQKKIVSLKWLKDSLDRTMQLDETLYHPTKSIDQQGHGAWNRNARSAPHLGKRPREEQKVVEPSRKLRRTASAKFSSQNENMWGDIVAGGALDSGPGDRDPLRTSKSMPAIQPERQVAVSFAADDAPQFDIQQQRVTARPPQGFFMNKYFYIHGFDARKTLILTNHILGNGGMMLDSLGQVQHLAKTPPCEEILLVPYNFPSSDLPALNDPDSLPDVVTDLWIEYCLERRAFVTPTHYPPGRLMESFPLRGFESLIIGSTGFQGTELRHVCLIVVLMGGKYDEMFTPMTSVLVCKGPDSSTEKLRGAHEWNIPVVSFTWLWSCIKACEVRPFDEFLLNAKFQDRGQVKTPPKEVDDHEQQADVKGLKVQKQPETIAEETMLPQQKTQSVSAKEVLNQSSHEELSQKQRPGSDFFEQTSPWKARASGDPEEPRKETMDKQIVHGAEYPTIVTLPEGLRLRETSTSHSLRDPSPIHQQRKPFFRTFDGNATGPETDQQELQQRKLSDQKIPVELKEMARDAKSINGEIQDLLNLKVKAKSTTSSESEVPGKKNKLLGRALSNISNSSLGSNIRPSRASSVDSMNTDGVGSEIGPEPEISNIPARSTFTGRAKPREPLGNGASIELGDTGLFRNNYGEEEVTTPQMTQLGYEDPEEAIQLREKLAESRRRKSRLGQEDEEIKKKPVQKREEKRIQDDQAMMGVEAGWGAGRRTRHRDKGPQTMKGF